MTQITKGLYGRIKNILESKLYEWQALDLKQQELELVEQIQKEISKQNRNNITRTKAYLQMYQQFPELHWAFLAHMVSRNGGWHMTDLKGELFPHLLEPNEIDHFFLSLEQANSLIFQDAYPQLLLYGESVKQQKNLFYLLPAFHVSRFMQPIWNHFLTEKSSPLLTVSLIINEQNYIQNRVVKNPVMKKYVYQTWEYKAQSLLQLTQVVFPFFPQKGGSARNNPRLAGLTVEDFTNLDERIKIGIALYGILFGIRDVFDGALHFALQNQHTGSRADYWAHIFSDFKLDNQNEANQPYEKERLIANQLRKDAPRFYSPKVEEVWEDQSLNPPERFDWYKNRDDVIDYFRPIKPPRSFDMTDNFFSGLNRVELAVLAKNYFRSPNSK